MKLIQLIFYNIYKIIFILILFLVLYQVWQQDPELETINLPEEVVKLGTPESQFTNEVKENAQNIINSYISKEKNEDYKKIVENYKLNPNSCNYINPNIADINFYAINLRSEDIDIPIQGINSSTNVVIKLLKKYLNYQHTIFKSYVRKNEQTSDYTVKFRVAYTDLDTLENVDLRAKDINDAKDIISLLLVKYSNPAIYASITSFNEPSEIEKLINSASKYYSKYKSNSFNNTLIGHSILISNRYNPSNESYREAESYFEKALTVKSNDDLAKIDKIIIKINSKSNFNYDEDIVSLKKIVNNGHYTLIAYKILYAIQSKNNISNAIDTIKSGIEKYPSNYDLKIYYAYLLLKNKQYDNAIQFINSQTITNTNRLNKDDISKLSYLENIIYLFSDTKIDSSKMNANFEKMNECDFLDWDDKVITLTEFNPNHLNILELLYQQFLIKQNNGMSGFGFYSLFARNVQLIGTQKNDSALLEYSIKLNQESLNYPGDHSMSYYNTGHLLNKLGRFSEAENAFKKSIDLKKSPMNVNGYLASLYAQNKFDEYVLTYIKFEFMTDQLNIVDPNGLFRTERYLEYGVSQCELNNKELAEKIYQDSNKTYSENIKKNNLQIDKLNKSKLTDDDEKNLSSYKNALVFYKTAFLPNLNRLDTCLKN